ncbi:ATPase synthesis protein-like protein [Hapsidospora chrysogenum ATCC 11550]|uniref:ATPase synthesis protein 25 n=1 Tax=Hapsidospora chrysogenum (strain ATCC 11550 / CBS 779.69 / DSM 880 / IAM 14645 / JCM 23072 / IMI 49137) TaxID=857340 RepID=A0A086T7E2_HAPC1|nr:ATPase synthesis protein-like protein [Hapsidospora chrysogenum ATCC 11550]
MRAFPLYTTRKPLQLVARRAFSTKQSDAVQTNAGEPSEDAVENPGETPWFLEEEPPRHPPGQHKVDLPKVPDDAPAMLRPMLKYVYEDMGLDDISMLDLRDLDPPASLGSNLIMLFATARSERHLHVSSGRFVRWLRRNHNVGARAEGLIGAGELKTKLRRLRKKAKLMGQNTAMIPGGDNGISTGWVCVNFRVNDGASTEEANFDESGSFSGFGTSQSGTSIVVQCMTESRRTELDLETLWKGILRRNLDQQAKIRGETTDAAKLDEMLASKLQLHNAPAASQWDAMKRASQQHRYFSTSARRLQSTAQTAERGPSAISEVTSDAPQEPEKTKVDGWATGVIDVLIAGAPMDQDRLEHLASEVLGAPLTAEMGAADRLALLDQLLASGEERGLAVRSRSMLVTLIESLVTSPAYGPELGRAQKNCEMLLTDDQEPLDVKEVARLMNAYSYRQDWDRFWDVFRTPTRFNQPRSAPLYELAFRTMASTKDAVLCTEALRWVYPEMLTEQPSIRVEGRLYRSLKSCILVADPAAENLLYYPPPADGILEARKLKHREFTRVLGEVETIREHLRNTSRPQVISDDLGGPSLPSEGS